MIEELDRTNRLVEELKPKLERAQLEVDQAKQDSELALIRVQEMEQRIDDEASVIAQTQLTVAKERHKKAVEELKLLKEELISTHEQYAVLELTLELIASKESLSQPMLRTTKLKTWSSFGERAGLPGLGERAAAGTRGAGTAQ